MLHSDFNHIDRFTCKEVESTGANIADVKYDTIHFLDRVRSIIGSPIHLIHNGITTGKHSSAEHKNGEAVDFHVPEADPVRVVLACCSVGFKGIGVYRNNVGAYSYHMDTRKDLAIWYGVKKDDDSWKYKPLTFKK